MKIIVCEYPKSGGSWLSSMIATALQLPARDLYFAQPGDIKGTTLDKHPWYAGAVDCALPESCVIKSHERAGTKLHPAGARVIHLVRDGRDVCISKYFYDRRFRTSNEHERVFDLRLRDYIAKTAADWAGFVDSWSDTGVITSRYEALLDDTGRELARLIEAVGAEASAGQIDKAVKAHDRESMRKAFRAAYAGADFVRKGIAGDWTNYFSAESHDVFLGAAGRTMEKAGYSTSGFQDRADTRPRSVRADHLELWELSGFEEQGMYSVTGVLDSQTGQLLDFLHGKGWRTATHESLRQGGSSGGAPGQEAAVGPRTNFVFLGSPAVGAAPPDDGDVRPEARDALIVSASRICPGLLRSVGGQFRLFTAHGSFLVLARRSPTCPKPSWSNRLRAWRFVIRAWVSNLTRTASA